MCVYMRSLILSLTTGPLLALLVASIAIRAPAGVCTSTGPADGHSVGRRGSSFRSGGRGLPHPGCPSTAPVGRRAGAAHPSSDVRVASGRRGQSREGAVVIRRVCEQERI